MTKAAATGHAQRAAHGSLCALSLLLATGSAWAQSAPIAPAGSGTEASTPKTIWQQDTLSGDWGGARTWLSDRGVTFNLTETDEGFGNVSGGLRRGAIFEGLTKMGVGLDLDKLIGWQGGTLTASAYQIHGRGLSANYVGNLLTVSNIEAESGTRLGDLYFEQSLFSDKVNLRIGQFAADEEFLTSDVAGVFLNSTFGWPGIFGTDLPNGGPAYPFSTPGARLRVNPTDKASVQAAIFSGNPLGNDGNPGGIHFPIDGVFAIVEASYSTMPGKNDPGLGGNFKVGGWYNSLRFDDLHLDNTGQSLASPTSSGVPATHTGNYGIYASVDHQLYRMPGSEDRGLSGFARIAMAPQQDRNTLYVYTDAGLTWKGTFPGRDDDTVGLAFAWANVSHALRSLDMDTNFYTGVDAPIQSAEMVLELTYQAPITPWLTVQPDFQYVIHPGGNIPQPDNPTQALKNAAIFGLRGTITF
jgi:porin